MKATDASGARTTFVVLVALLLGFVGLVLVFSDPAEGWPLRVITAAVFFLLAGAAVGYVYPGGWPIAMLAAWGGVLTGGSIIIMAVVRFGSGAFSTAEPPYISSGLILLFGPLGSTFFGGLLGRSLRKRSAQILAEKRRAS